MEKEMYCTPDCEILQLEVESGVMDASNGNEDFSSENFDPEFD